MGKMAIFHQVVSRVFAPVKAFFKYKNLPLKTILVMDNAPTQPPRPEEELSKEDDFMQVKFPPLNTTPPI